jgi:hypothetical protein
MANHPPAGVTPNVMLASVDFLVEDAALRPYVPVLSYTDVSRSTFVEDDEEGAPASVATQRSSVPGAVLVALRPLDNEELWLNYRLNPNSPGGLPEWYASCDGEEDARRWA